MRHKILKVNTKLIAPRRLRLNLTRNSFPSQNKSPVSHRECGAGWDTPTLFAAETLLLDAGPSTFRSVYVFYFFFYLLILGGHFIKMPPLFRVAECVAFLAFLTAANANANNGRYARNYLSNNTHYDRYARNHQELPQSQRPLTPGGWVFYNIKILRCCEKIY